MPALGPDAMRPRALRRTARRQELRSFPHCVFRAGFGIHYSRAIPAFKSFRRKGALGPWMSLGLASQNSDRPWRQCWANPQRRGVLEVHAMQVLECDAKKLLS